MHACCCYTAASVQFVSACTRTHPWSDQSTAIGKALKRAGHDKREPMNHFENFDAGIDKAIDVTANFIASDCGSLGWDTFKEVVLAVATPVMILRSPLRHA